MSQAHDTTTVWLIMLAIGIGTYGMRLSFIHLAGRLPLPQGLTRALRFVPAAVLSALVAPAILQWDPASGLDVANDLPRLVAGLTAAIVAWTTRGVLSTLIVGMGVLWGLSAVL